MDNCELLALLEEVDFPESKSSLLDLDLLGKADCDGRTIRLDVCCPSPFSDARQALEEGVREALSPLVGAGVAGEASCMAGASVAGEANGMLGAVGEKASACGDALSGSVSPKMGLELTIHTEIVNTQRSRANVQVLPGVKNIVAVASGKGGVGKSTATANLAAAFASSGARVGILDADVYGPSIPDLLGLRPSVPARHAGKLVPPEARGMRVMSVGLMTPEQGQSVVWRGPMLHKVMQQFVSGVEWGDLDFLFIDLPPGTGDVQLSLCQLLPLSGVVVISTPQDAALKVAVKAIDMFEKLHTPILGVIENMSYYVCGDCGKREYLFGHGGAAEASLRLGLPFLGELPIEVGVREGGDEGAPVVLGRPQSAASQAFQAIARRVVARLVELSCEECGFSVSEA